MNSKSGKWSRKYDNCIKCNTSDSRYMGNGMCNLCYLKEYRENPINIPRIKESKRKFYVTKITPELTKAIREETHFNSKREDVLIRDGYQCTECGSKDKLIVHHKDKSGRGQKIGHNNDLSNLETLCRACHINTHRNDLLEAKKSIQ